MAIQLPDNLTTLTEKLAYLGGLQDGQRTEHNGVGGILSLPDFNKKYRPAHKQTALDIAKARGDVRRAHPRSEVEAWDRAHGNLAEPE